MSDRSACPLCSERQANVFLVRENVPAHQNLLFGTQEAAQNAERGDLRLAVCDACGFIFNVAFDYGKLAYHGAYENDQTCSPTFRDHVDSLVHHLVDDQGIRDCFIVEVGSGSGYFLRRLISHAGGTTRGIGFDPTHDGPDSELDGDLRFVRACYDASAAGTPGDVVLCRYVLEHLPNAPELVALIGSVLSGSKREARIFVETPAVDWILRNEVIWDLYYEHCALFSPGSLTTLFERGGFRVDSIEERFGGQYLCLLATRAVVAEPTRQAGQTPALARRFAVSEREALEQWAHRIESLATTGPVALWGAGAKGTTLANLVDPALVSIDCLVDVNPRKHGTFVGGSGHPIVGVHSLARRGVKTALMMNPNYVAESEALVREAGIDLRIVV